MKLGSRYDQAFLFASSSHRDQTRKSGDVPYLSHVLRVSGLVLEYGGTEDEAIAALLHDVAEDCGGRATLARISAKFGEAPAAMVAEVSDSLAEDPSLKAPWRERKESFIARLSEISSGAALIACCDKIDNVRSLIRAVNACSNVDDVFRLFKGGREGSLWYYQEVSRALSARNCVAARELAFVVDELVKLLRLK